MMGRRPRMHMIVALIAAAAMVTALAGCVSVPTSGKVEQAGRAGSVSTKRNEVVPKPPARDATPLEIVKGFLLAMTRYQSNYHTARQFLSSDARDSWRPEDRVTIYAHPHYKVSKKNVKMSMNKTGKLGKDSNYAASSGKTTHNFKMRRTRQGQWRISNPPHGLLISENSFSGSYDPYNIYFFDPEFQTVVPEPVYLPTEAQTATALVQRLLAGPSDWLHGATTSPVPAKTTLITNSVPVEDGLAKISLSDTINDLDSQQRENLAAQLAWTLKQVDSPDIKRIQITADGETYHIPGERKKNGNRFISTDVGDRLDPVPRHRDMIAGIHHNRVASLDPSASHPKPKPIDGPLGRSKFQVDSLALAADGKTVAAVTDGRGQLRTQSTKGGKASVILDDRQRLLRPDFTRNDELWAISGKRGNQQVSAIQRHHVKKVRASWLSEVNVTAFQISPDASRIAVIVRHDGKDRLAMAPITRGDHWSLGKLRSIQVLDNASAPIDRIADLGWISPTQLMILGASGKGGAHAPYGVKIDGSEVERIGVSEHWHATALSAVPESSGSFRAVVGGRENKVWIRQSGDQWTLLTEDLDRPAYAG